VTFFHHQPALFSASRLADPAEAFLKYALPSKLRRSGSIPWLNVNNLYLAVLYKLQSVKNNFNTRAQGEFEAFQNTALLC